MKAPGAAAGERSRGSLHPEDAFSIAVVCFVASLGGGVFKHLPIKASINQTLPCPCCDGQGWGRRSDLGWDFHKGRSGHFAQVEQKGEGEEEPGEALGLFLSRKPPGTTGDSQ